MGKQVEFYRVHWREWAIQPPYEHRKIADLTERQFRRYNRLIMNVSLTDAAEYATACHQQNLIRYANSKKVLVR